MIQLRSFRNIDPPSLVEVWNESFTQRGAYPIRSAALFEHCLFSKPFFDPAGLIVAEEDGRLVGFSHAGFGPNSAENDLSMDVGIICAVAVRPSHRRRRIGTQLIERAEEYLLKHGSTDLIAGGMRPLNPFYFGIYGGADSPGVLASEACAAPFFERLGYSCWTKTQVLERRLEQYQPVVDPRFLAVKRRHDVQLIQQPEISSWWQDCVLGWFEPVEFRLVDKLSGIPAARALVWEMSAGRPPGNSAAGILDVHVRPDMRQQGLGKFLLNTLLRYIQEQFFRTAEVHVPESNEALLGLFKGLGFEQVDVGHSYKKG